MNSGDVIDVIDVIDVPKAPSAQEVFDSCWSKIKGKLDSIDKKQTLNT